MLIKRYIINELFLIISKNADKAFDIQTQYKLIKMKKTLNEEVTIYNEQLSSLQKFYETENGQIIRNEEGGIKIKEENLEECAKLLNDINNLEVQIPDVYFSLDELEPLALTLGELELFEPFIK